MIYIFANGSYDNVVMNWTVGKNFPDLSKYNSATIHASGKELKYLSEAMKRKKG